jgi:Holliday junction resolvasome RuvABC endonuclease subunit
MARRRPVNSKTKMGGGVFMGIDPDVNHTGICVIEDGEVVAGVLVKPAETCDPNMDLRWRMAMALATEMDVLFEEFSPELVIIEWQAIRPSDPRPNDILELCSVGGMALALAAREGIPVLRPLPVAWKGSVPKKIHQTRILTAAKANDKDKVWDGIAKGKLNHVIDALGLAMWGSQ